MKFKTLGSIALTILLVSGFSGCGSSDNDDKVDTTALGYQTIADDGTITYVDYTGGTRQAAPTAGDAEYHTGIGYGNTLFDSAENKCQNCHNELYDTWQDSMHGKSWNDPIFQSKFRDFLRVQLAKIGEDNTAKIGADGVAGIEYTEQVFKGAAQTCIKCHAPGAFYAGDVKITVNQIEGAETTMDKDAFASLKAELEATGNNGAGEIAVIAASAAKNAMYKATFQIGHEANQEGINCAFCHSIETPRLMGLGHDGDKYTLAKHLRSGPHGPAKAAAGSDLIYNESARDADMNKFFRLIGPEKYHDNNSDNAHTPTEIADFDEGKLVDGRYTMASKDINGTDGKTHFTGGPFYGPYGVTGLKNENESDDTNRTANPNFHYGSSTSFNHFGDQGKALCLSCHQRSAGAAVPSGENGAGEFMELCSTWNAVTTGTDNNHEDTMTSPKCQKCHMEKIEGTVLHQWAKPDQLFTDKELLTPHFYPDDADGKGDAANPVKGKWLNSHAFLGGNKIVADKAAVVRKIKSGFDADISSSVDGDTLTVTTTFKNKTAHMLPGAHPMRRMLTRAIVTDSEGNMLTPTTMTGESAFGDITNTLATLTGKTIKFENEKTVSVNDAGNEALDFPGKVPDLNGSAVSSQRFYSDSGVGPVDWSAPDDTVKNQAVTDGQTTGKVFNAAIVDSNATQKFTRIYGHETGKRNADGLFVVRPGFDSNMVEIDTRLSPNETETYTLTYDISGKTGLSATYKVYYMQKGANGQFNEAEDGFLDQATSDANKHLVTEVFSKTVTP